MKKIFLLMSLLAIIACNEEIAPEPIAVESVELNCKTLTLAVGESDELTATVYPADAENKKIFWRSDNVEVAIVSEEGIVEAIAPGTANITVKTEDRGKTATCKVTVVKKNLPVERLTLDKEEIELERGESVQLVATVYPDDASNKTVIWESDDDSIATVEDGLVKGVNMGETIIRAQTEDGSHNAECTVVVTKDYQSQSNGPVTLKLGDVTETTAVLFGSIDIELAADYDGVGFRYSVQGEEKWEDVRITSVESDGAFSICLEGLSYDTEYQYKSYYLLKNGIYQYGETQKFKTDDVQVRLSVEQITQTTATFIGNIQLTDTNVLEVGLLYSSLSSDLKATTDEVNKIVLTDLMDIDGNVTHKAEGLLNDTNHYYRYYIKQDNIYTYGSVLTFKTDKVPPVSIQVDRIDRNVVTFRGNVQFSEAGTIEIGIQYYPKSAANQPSEIRTKAITEILENGGFTIEISGLLSATEYYWQYYLLQSGVKVVGSQQTFEIADVYNLQADLNMSSATDMSSSGSANCYIVSQAGTYKFKTVMGNGAESVGSVASASILWESFGTSIAPDYLELIEGVCYENGYIAFKTADTFREGNAVVAAKDASGNILWSWHIWMTDEPQEHVYRNDAGTMMDRNLGATSATRGDVGALGLLYQWGRKDPFLGSSSIESNTLAESTITWPSAVSSDSSNGTIEYATANPMTFITSRYGDWYYTGSNSADNTRWTTSETNKSIYDPCPTGWRVPDGDDSNGVWTKAELGNPSYDFYNGGMSFYVSSLQIAWYPASVYRDSDDGGLYHVCYYGSYWSSSPDGYTGACYLHFSSYGGVDLSAVSYRAYGYSVRCIQE